MEVGKQEDGMSPANRVGAGIEPAPPTPPGMRVRTGRFPSVMAPEDDPLQGRSDTEC
jgi:hypothetical protein